MKRCITYTFFFCALMFSLTQMLAQATSVQALGEMLTEAITTDDAAQFEALVIPKTSFMGIAQGNASPRGTAAQQQAAIAVLDSNYDSQVLPAFQQCFQHTKQQFNAAGADVSQLSFSIASTTNPQAAGPAEMIHAEMPNQQHLYFFALQDQGQWYLAVPVFHLMESEM